MAEKSVSVRSKNCLQQAKSETRALSYLPRPCLCSDCGRVTSLGSFRPFSTGKPERAMLPLCFLQKLLLVLFYVRLGDPSTGSSAVVSLIPFDFI